MEADELPQSVMSTWRKRLSRVFSSRVATSRSCPVRSTISAAAQTQTCTITNETSFCVDSPLVFDGSAVPWISPPLELTMFTPNPLLKMEDNTFIRPSTVTIATSTRCSQLFPALKKRLLGMFQVWNNRLTMKKFGSSNGIQKEQERMKGLNYWVIHPWSKFRMLWDLLMLIVLMSNMVVLPIAITFYHVPFITAGWLVFNGVSDSMFVLDLVFNFWTGIINKENVVVLDLCQIRKYYVKRWLVLDILSVFPFDYIFINIFHGDHPLVSSTSLIHLIELFSLLRLFRLARFLFYFSKWDDLLDIRKAAVRMCKFILAVLLLAHWNGCVQFYIPYLQNFPSDSWVAINNLQNATVGTQYSWGMFKAFSHMLCIGFGRFPPQNVTEAWVTVVSMLIGATMYAMFIGHISTLIYSVTSASRTYNAKLKQVEEYMRYRKLPAHLKLSVHEYYNQRYHGQFFDEDAILLELSQALKDEIINYNCQELVRVVPFFSDADETFITSVITRLTFEVFLPCDLIIRCGGLGNKMYFIQHGVVHVISSDGRLVAQLSDGSYFGEICLLMQSKRVASVKAITVCDIYCVSKDNFDVVLDEFPEMRLKMEAVARERLDGIRRIQEARNTPATSTIGNGCSCSVVQESSSNSLSFNNDKHFFPPSTVSSNTSIPVSYPAGNIV